ncbi:MAG TPA: cytochrome bc complex cytochrome b subunit [Terriglobales bacterium]|nr:cytochrome bc complex cytochrome b subunit [Terriglobales bacterium]
MKNLVTRAYEWLDERLDLQDLMAPLRHKTVPVHYYSYWYYLGGITLFLFLVQVFTGILLLLYYRPSANEAFESVQFIMTRVQFGWLIRSIHSWAANLMIFFAFAHMFSVLFLRSYRKPRELTWVSGMVLLVLAMGFGFSGYLLPWNTLAFFATKVGTDIVRQVPVVGHWLMVFLRGGEDVTGATLSRFFGLHVAVLPGITTLLLAIHLALIQRQGISVPGGMEGAMHALKYLRKHDPAAAELWLKQAGAQAERREMPFFPNFFLRELMAWYVALGVLGALAALAPWELGTKADAFAPAPAGIRPEWYFLWMFQTLKLIPAKLGPLDGEMVGVLAFSVAGGLWLLLPFFDRGEGRGSRWILGAGIFALVYMTAMSVYGYLAS